MGHTDERAGKATPCPKLFAIPRRGSLEDRGVSLTTSDASLLSMSKICTVGARKICWGRIGVKRICIQKNETHAAAGGRQCSVV